jgi:hypothetical protein
MNYKILKLISIIVKNHLKAALIKNKSSLSLNQLNITEFNKI